MNRTIGLALLLPALACAADFKIEAGLLTTDYDYTETQGSIVLDTEDSSFGDIKGGYARFSMSLFENAQGGTDGFEVYLSRTTGDTKYTGSYIGSGLPYGSVISTTENEFADLQANYTRSLPIGSLEGLVRLGVGYHEWVRTLSAFQEETYYWYYAQAGVAIEESIYKSWTLGLDFTAQYALYKKMDATSPSLNATFDLGQTYSLRTGIPMNIPITDALTLTLRAEYEFTSIGHSDFVLGYYEPDSEQKNWHLSAGMSYRF